jgi:uncharacterized protein (DUF885 family)
VSSAVEEFADAAESAIDTMLAADPVSATSLGDHRYDGQLPDRTEGAVRELLTHLDDHLARLDAVDDVELPITDQVDLEIVRARVAALRFELAEVRRYQWDPLVWNPATALYLLASRDFAPASERVDSGVERLKDVPRFLADARATLGEMSEIHVETAVGQLAGFESVTAMLADLARETGRDISDEIESANEAVAEYRLWLREQQPLAHRDPRLGVRLYSGALWHNLDEEITPGEILEAAERHLDDTTAIMRDVAAQFLGEKVTAPGVVRRALARMADESPVSDATVLGLAEHALERTTEFVRDHDLVMVPDCEIRIIEMPEIHRGVAVAYCDAPGPLEIADIATYVAVAPTPEGWSEDRVQSFYREYNGVLVHDLMVHEAMPGHVLQLAHARDLDATTRVRRFGRSGVFVEGWAVYAEEMMVAAGYVPDDRPDAHLRLQLQQLKMSTRMALNAILDARVHGGDITEPEALDLLDHRGFQEEGEARGKWRRALLTATQLPTYFVGYLGVRSIADDLRVVHPDWSARQVHDLMLAHGSPGPRHLRALLGL